MLSYATFGAFVYTYDCSGCCKKVQVGEFNTLFGGDFAVERCNVMEPSSRYMTCELSGSSGCLNCEVSELGSGFMNVRTSYEDKVSYSKNPPSMFIRDYDCCLN